MQKTVTDAFMRRLKKACLDISRKDACRMECEAHGGKIGFCDQAWAIARQAK